LDLSIVADIDLSPRNEPPAGSSSPAKRKRNVWPMILLGAVIVAGGVIVTQFLNSAVDYFCNVDEVGVRDGCEEGRRIRLQGTVEAGSVDTSVPGITAFTMAFGGEQIDVSYDGIPGGIFKECIPVVVHGEIVDGKLSGDLVEVKHSNEYVAVNDENLTEANEYSEIECPA
jgi:cytochrome c-type biogenesis protein CcmE